MTNWRNTVNRYKSIAWLIAVLVLFLAMTSAQHHLHHVVSDDLSHHEHTIDLHTTFEVQDPDHLAADLEAFSATPDGILKKTGAGFPPVLLLLLLFSILPVLTNRIFVHSVFQTTSPKQGTPHFSPPLRAPPLY